MAEHAGMRPCPACGEPRSTWAFAVHGFPHVRCTGCRTLFVSPLPSPAVIRATYLAPDYHHSAQGAESRMLEEAEARARQLARLEVTRLLEIGCGKGYLLDACAGLGMHVEGVDPAVTAERARARGHTIHATWLDALELDDTFDAVAMFEVIEHLDDPLAALRRVRKFLRPRGILALSTPSSDGVPARLLGRRFPMITPPDHLCLLTRKGLWTLLARAGFEVVRWSSFSGLGRVEIARGLQRFALGASPVARSAARALAVAGWLPAKAVDRMGFGTSFELYARMA